MMGAFLFRDNRLNWQNLSAAAAGHADSANRDPSSQHSSFASDPTGTTIAALDTVSTAGWNQGPAYDIVDVADLFPSWAPDGNYWLILHGTPVTEPSKTSGYWQTVAILEAGTPTDGVGAGLQWTGGFIRSAVQTDTAIALTWNASDVVVASAVFMITKDGARMSAATLGAFGAAAGFDSGNGTTPLKLAICAGCESSAASGPITGKVLWKVALIRVTP